MALEKMMAMTKFMDGAPEEVKAATYRAAEAFKRLRKAMTQVEAWKQEHSLANRAHEVAAAEQIELLNRWDPETNAIAPKPLQDAPVLQ